MSHPACVEGLGKYIYDKMMMSRHWDKSVPLKKEYEANLNTFWWNVYDETQVSVSGVDKVLDDDIIVSKFELQSCYYINFWTNTRGKAGTIKHLSNGLKTTTVLQEWL